MRVDESYSNPRFVSLQSLVAQSGVSSRTVRRRLAREGIGTYVHPQDNRSRLVLREDVAGLFDIPQPVRRPREGVRAAP